MSTLCKINGHPVKEKHFDPFLTLVRFVWGFTIANPARDFGNISIDNKKDELGNGIYTFPSRDPNNLKDY